MRKEESDKKSTVQSYDTLYADPASAKQASKSAFRVGCIVTMGIFVILIVAIILGFTSCSKRDEKSVLRYLKSRYGEEFVVTDTESDANESGGSETVFYYTTTAYCYPVSNPDCVFKTKLKHNRNNADTITDNYAAVLVSRQLGVAFQEKLGDRFGDAAVYTECNASLGDDAAADPAGYLHDYIADADAKPLRIHYYVVVNLDTYTTQDYDT